MKKINLSYVAIPLITILVAGFGGLITSSGMEWYQSINLPGWTPSGQIIGLVWTIIFALSTIAALLVWNSKWRKKDQSRFNRIIIWFLINIGLNLGWSFIFFGRHLIFIAIEEAILLCLSVIRIIWLAWPVDKRTVYLLLPYALWTAFAAYLTYNVWLLNK
jgi:benzodiazapine receptor